MMIKKIFIAVLFILFGLIIGQFISIGESSSSHLAYGFPPAKITKITDPTLGKPIIQKRGNDISITFDFTEGGAKPQPSNVSEWSVKIITSLTTNEYATTNAYPLTVNLPLKSATFSDLVWKITASIPDQTPEDLYDLYVSVTADGSPVSDVQMHAVKVVKEFKTKFTFIQLTDIHIGSDQGTDHERANWAYFKKEIKQLNLIKPDFVVTTGDHMFGQRYSGEYDDEYPMVYNELMALDVPIVMAPGNHDGYVNSDTDGQEAWKKYFAPLYYSWDYGNYHFTCVNSYDFSASDRKFYGLYIVLHWGGRIRADQRTWIQSDLSSHISSTMRFAIMHHDPLKLSQGTGKWEGEGQTEMLQYLRDYKATLVNTGHDHEDWTGTQNWTAGDGKTVFGNTTSAALCTGQYPGMRMMNVDGSTLVSYNYQDPKYSVPTYKETNVGGSTNLENLTTPSIVNDFSYYPTSTNSTSTTVTINNYLTANIEGATLELPMAKLSGGYYYLASGGTIDQVSELTDNLIYYVKTDLAPQGTQSVSLQKSATPDNTPPNGSILINDGATSTYQATVNLTLAATDSITGVSQMSIANDSSFTGSSWEQFSSSKYWTLSSGYGTKTVYVKFKDFAGNPSNPYSDSIDYNGLPDTIPPTGAVSINGGVASTHTSQVNLTLNATDNMGVDKMIIGNSSTFSGANWESYNTNKSWTLTSGDGSKTIYAKFKDAAGNPSPAYSSSIYLVSEKKVIRLAGLSRYDTAVAISKYGWSSSNYIIIARGDLYPDALAGAPLAFKYQAPLLLSDTTFLRDVVIQEIKRLKSTKAILLGSTNALSEQVESDLVNKAGLGENNIERIGGKDRYETAAKIGLSVKTLGGISDTAVVATGENFPDALAISGFAAQKGMAILLVNKTAFDINTESALKNLEIKKSIILGGEGAVPKGIENWLNAQGYLATRISGADRYETAKNIADYAYKNGFNPERIFISTGENFPDALTSGPLASIYKAPLFLVRKSILPTLTEQWISSNKNSIYYIYVTGGTDVVSDEIGNEILNLVK